MAPVHRNDYFWIWINDQNSANDIIVQSPVSAAYSRSGPNFASLHPFKGLVRSTVESWNRFSSWLRCLHQYAHFGVSYLSVALPVSATYSRRMVTLPAEAEQGLGHSEWNFAPELPPSRVIAQRPSKIYVPGACVIGQTGLTSFHWSCRG